MKKTLCALLIGISSVIGCNNPNPVVKQPEGGKAMIIPYDCSKVNCMSENENIYRLTCIDKNDRPIYYKYDWIRTGNWRHDCR